MINFVKPTMEMMESIALDMRQDDINEVWASNHHTPIESLVIGWNLSDLSTIATDDHGVPLVMFGIVKRDLLTDSGVIWMLGTNKSLKYKRDLLFRTKLVIDEMLTVCSRLCNMVHSKNTKSIEWLKRLGFTVEDTPISYGLDNESFHRFYLERIQ